MSEYGYCEMRSTINGPEIIHADKRILVSDDLLLGTGSMWTPHRLDGVLLTLCADSSKPMEYELVAWDAGKRAHVAVRLDAPKTRARAAAGK